jgi:hypothetical protein
MAPPEISSKKLPRDTSGQSSDLSAGKATDTNDSSGSGIEEMKIRKKHKPRNTSPLKVRERKSRNVLCNSNG